MLSYLHAYHAGNHADILKHFVLVSVINYLNKKDKPYTFFDTHSGSALYGTESEMAEKTGEIKKGIKKIVDYKPKVENKDYADYAEIVKSYSEKKLYPGSPVIELSFMRSSDFLVLSELHPSEVEKLRQNVKNETSSQSPKVSVHFRNGFENLFSQVPPKTKRGAVLIDPSYEESSDYVEVADCVERVLQKWNGAVIMVWYPLLSHRKDEIQYMVERLEAAACRFCGEKYADFRLQVQDENAHKETSLDENDSSFPRLYGSGMFVINPPYTLVESCGPVIKEIESILGNFEKN